MYVFLDNSPVHRFDAFGLKREPGQSYEDCYNACMSEFALVDLSDNLGYWGLGAAAVGLGQDWLIGKIDKAAANAAKDATRAAANHPGPMGPARWAAAKSGAAKAARIGLLRGALAVVGKVALPVGIAAMGYSGGTRAYCDAQCSDE